MQNFDFERGIIVPINFPASKKTVFGLRIDAFHF